MRSWLGLAVRVRIMRPPPRGRRRSSARRSAAAIPASVTRTSTSSSSANRIGVSVPTLLASARHDDLAGGTRPSPAWWRPRRGRGWRGRARRLMPLVPRKATSARSSPSAPHGVGADRGLGGGADPAGQQVQLDLRGAGQPGGDGYGVGDDGEPVVAGEQAGEPAGRGAGVEQHGRPPAAGAGRGRPWRSGPSASVLAESRSPRPDSITVSASRRHGAAVHPADQAHPLERGQVAAHGLGGDVVLLGESR